MLAVLTPLLAATGVVTTSASDEAAPQSDADSLRSRGRPYPLNCRGGGQVLLDTSRAPTDTGVALRLSLTFAASPTAAGQEGQGLSPGTCAWVDRPLNRHEPPRVRFRPAIADSTPRRTLRDSSIYWSFLAYTSDSGHLTAVGHRHWQAPATATVAPAAPVAARAPSKGSWLPFNPRYLPLYAVGWMVIAWIPLLTMLGMWSGWRRLAGLYPGRMVTRGRTVRCGSMVMGLTNYRSGVRLTADDSHLHFSMLAPFRPGHPPFSVPWSDITATRDGWPWFPFKGDPVVRLTLARQGGLRILVPVKGGEGIVAASGGRLGLSESRVAAARAR